MIELEQRTVVHVLDRGAASMPGKTAVIDDVEGLTYAQLRDAAHRVASGLRGLGVQPRDPVVLMMGNTVDHVLAWLATSCLNAIEVALNTALKPSQIAQIINHSQATVMVVEEAQVGTVRQIADQLPAVHTLVVRGDPGAARDVPVTVIGFDELRRAAPIAAVRVGPHDVMGIVYTSGTTGQPKGVMVSQAQSYGRMWPGGPGTPRPEDRTLVVLPIYHVLGQCRALYNTLIAGGTAVLVPRFSASGFWDTSRDQNISFVPLVGIMVTYLLRQPERANDRSHPIRHIALGTTSPQLKQFRERFAVPEVSMSYGLTEAGGVLVGPAEPAGCGFLRPDFEALLVDERDNVVPAGEVGELVLRPSEPWTVMAGYYCMPEATVERWRNLWLHTSDLMYQREDGMYLFAGRRSDRIRVKGENVSAAEVEEVVLSHPAVAECAVTGIAAGDADAAVGEEEILAAVVLEPERPVDPAELVEFASARLPAYAVPRYVALLAELPRTDATYRVQRNVLAALPVDTLWDRHQHVWQSRSVGSAP